MKGNFWLLYHAVILISTFRFIWRCKIPFFVKINVSPVLVALARSHSIRSISASWSVFTVFVIVSPAILTFTWYCFRSALYVIYLYFVFVIIVPFFSKGLVYDLSILYQFLAGFSIHLRLFLYEITFYKQLNRAIIKNYGENKV